MNAPVKLILGAVATGCIVVGVAAQTGTLQMPGDSSNGAAAPAPSQPSQASPSPSPEPTQAPEPSPVVEATSPKKKKHGDG
jgi:hypothetical protein